jgi:CHAD domain-containing protein
MAFEFERTDRTVQAGVRRIVAEEIEAALAALDDEGRPLPERIHAARKAVKKLRGLIRLVRPGFPAYATENAALRKAGRRLSGLRESEVARATLATLAEGAGLSQAEMANIAAPLLDRRAAEHEALEQALDEFVAAMEAIRGRATKWRIKGKEFGAVERGLADTWSKARRALKRAAQRGRDEDLHDWRKRAKDHWYQTRLLFPIWQEAMAPHLAAADRLGVALGDYNDLSQIIRDLAEGDGNDGARARLVEEAVRRRAALREETIPLGRRLFAGPSEALIRRWRAWWKIWRE